MRESVKLYLRKRDYPYRYLTIFGSSECIRFAMRNQMNPTKHYTYAANSSIVVFVA